MNLVTIFSNQTVICLQRSVSAIRQAPSANICLPQRLKGFAGSGSVGSGASSGRENLVNFKMSKNLIEHDRTY
jgi:hypothetical protein